MKVTHSSLDQDRTENFGYIYVTFSGKIILGSSKKAPAETGRVKGENFRSFLLSSTGSV